MFSTPVAATNSAYTPMITSPTLELVKCSSSSGEEFEVEHLSLSELEDRFRIAPRTTDDMPSEFMGTAGAALFIQNSGSRVKTEHVVDTRGSVIENELMDLLDEVSEVSSITFIGSSEDEVNPFFGANFANVERKSYGRPVQRVQPTIRQSQTTRPTTNPPIVPSQNSAFTTVIHTMQWTQGSTTHSLPQASYLSMPVPFCPDNWNNVRSDRHDYNAQMQHTRMPKYKACEQPANFANEPVRNAWSSWVFSRMLKDIQPDSSGNSHQLCGVLGVSRGDDSQSQHPIKGICGWVWSSVDLFQK